MNAPTRIGVKIHRGFEQGSERWHQARCGVLTASEFERLLTPPKPKPDGGWSGLKVADNVKERAHLWELAAQRISGFVEPHYMSDAMLRGKDDEVAARELYSERYAKVQQVGLITNNKFGFKLACSPDGLVGRDGLIEIKSRCQRFQVQTTVENLWNDEAKTIPEDYILQVQGLLLVSEREWCDFISYCGGLHMLVIRVFPDPVIQDAIVDAASKFEARINEAVRTYFGALKKYAPRLTPTEREMEIIL
jgi:hypothetical protein